MNNKIYKINLLFIKKKIYKINLNYKKIEKYLYYYILLEVLKLYQIKSNE